MRTNKKLIIGIFVLAILLIPLASASGNVNKVTTTNLSKSYHFSSNNSVLLSKIWGKNMTKAEFAEKVFPGSLDKLPKDIIENLKKEPMVWPKTNIQPGEKTENTTKSSESSNGGGATPLDIWSRGIYGILVGSQVSVGGGMLGYESYTYVIYPTETTTIPFMEARSHLFKDGGTSAIDTCWDLGYDTNIVNAYSSLPVSGHHSYYAAGTHDVIWPLGCNPETGEYFSTSTIVRT